MDDRAAREGNDSPPYGAARAAIAALGEPASSLLMAAHGLDGRTHQSAMDLIRTSGLDPASARAIVLRATVALAGESSRPAFETLLRHFAESKGSGRVNDPWHKLAVILTRGTISRWAR